MSIAVAISVHDGVVLAADSASTLAAGFIGGLPGAGPQPVAMNVYNNANTVSYTHLLRTYAIELQKSATAEERKKLEAEFAELNDRALLAGMLQPVQDELERLRSIHFLEQCVADALGDHLKTGQ